MQYSSALQIICSNTNALCRREKWGKTVKHVYVESCESDQLIMTNEDGALFFYIPSIDDLLASDWLIIY